MANLPEDVIFRHILIEVPAKRLAQLRCVCKSWNTRLSESSYIKLHLENSMTSIRNNGEVLMVFYNGFSFDERKLFLLHHSRSPHIKLHNFIKLPVDNLPFEYAHRSIIGSTNGLIFFSYGSNPDPIKHIWNPSLSALMTLPPYNISSYGYLGVDLFIRFGFDPKTDNYKVVKFTRLVKPSINGISFHGSARFLEWFQVEVYNMKKGYWESINERVTSHVNWIEDNCYETFWRNGQDGHDSHLHWMCYVSDGLKAKSILAFDLGVETFSEISPPDSVVGFNMDQRVSLTVLDGKLCVMSSIENGDFEVWVMNKYGRAESWVKRHVFSQFSGNICPIGFTLNNELLLQGDNYRLVLYDPIATKVKSFQFMKRGGYEKFKVVSYVDSFLWL